MPDVETPQETYSDPQPVDAEQAQKESAQKLLAHHLSVARAVHVDNSNRRSGDDVLEGHFGYVIRGEHAGRYGVFEEVVERDEDGYPTEILFRTRDDRAEYLTVAYADVRPDRAGKR